MICAIIDGSDVFRAKLRFRVFLIRELTKGNARCNRMQLNRRILSADCARRVPVSTIRQILNSVVSS